MSNYDKKQNLILDNTVSEAPKRGLRLNRHVSRQRRRVSAVQRLIVLLLAFCLVLLSARAFAACSLPPGNDADNLAIATLQVPVGKSMAGPNADVPLTEGTVIYDRTQDRLVMCDGTNWVEIGGSGGGPVLIGNGSSCGAGDEGAVRYTGGNPPFQYCDGGGNWLPFRQPRCQDDGAGECFLDANRANDDPQFVAANICSGANILGVSGTAVCGAPDTTPDAFSFTDQTGVAVSTLITSNIVTISGITGSVNVSVTGDGGPQVRINGGTWVTSGTIQNGQSLEVRLTSSASYGAMHSATVTVGTVSDQWDVMTVAQDTMPNAFSFTDQTGVAVSTLIASNSETITGITGSVNVSVTGDGSPQVRINGGTWVTSGTIQNGQSLEVRLTSSASYSTMHSATVTVGTVSDQWDVTTEDNSCPATPGAGNEGCLMPDGSVYAGVSPDGNVAMYTTPADAPGTYTWNDGSQNWVDTAMVNCTGGTPGPQSSCRTGEANTALLVGLSGSGSPAPYEAAEYCNGLNAHGHSDWYLPALDELNVLYTNRTAIGGFNISGLFFDGLYLSSSELGSTTAGSQLFNDGNQGGLNKNEGLVVRCVRR